jgi:Na+-translocating ferredoxin:NAD+ oxidoreductase RnfD subunit
VAAFFMLTDPVGSPFAPGGRIVSAVAAAAFMMIVRYYTPYPDGAVLAVLAANATSPLIDRWMFGRSAAPGPRSEAAAMASASRTRG